MERVPTWVFATLLPLITVLHKRDQLKDKREKVAKLFLDECNILEHRHQCHCGLSRSLVVEGYGIFEPKRKRYPEEKTKMSNRQQKDKRKIINVKTPQVARPA